MGIIIGIGNVSLKLTDSFELSGIELGTLIVLTGYHVLNWLSGLTAEAENPLLDSGTTSYDENPEKTD